jgi:hypothetical protein
VEVFSRQAASVGGLQLRLAPPTCLLTMAILVAAAAASKQFGKP